MTHRLRPRTALAVTGAVVAVTGFTGAAVADVVVSGTSRDEVLRGTTGPDRIAGRGGDDRLYGRAGGDRLFGGNGRDQLYGGPGRDELSGGRGVDLVHGGAGNDWGRASAGRDRIRLGAGNDTAELRRHGPTEVWLGGGNDGVLAYDVDGYVDVVHCGPGSDSVYYWAERDRADRYLGCERVLDAAH